MAEQLEILDIRIGAPRNAVHTATQKRLDLAIDVRNNSKNTLHVISSVRALDYDPATETLLLGLGEPEPGGEIKSRTVHFMMPHVTPIAPKHTETLKVSVPLVIHKIVPSSKLGMGVEDLDVSNLKHVKCRIAFAPTPFYPKRSEPPETILQKLRSWGTKTEKTFARTIGPPDDTAASPKLPRK